jgi:penicillin-binding protein 1A
MQAARNMFLNFDKSIRRKLQEIFLTYRMEHEFTKEQILSTYLNVIFLGQRSYGVAAAAETYFGKPLDQLSVAEAATLAGIPQAPSRYNPVTNPKAAQARRRYVLQQMQKLNYIDAATAQRAGQEPVTRPRPRHSQRRRGPLRRRDGARRSGRRYGEDAVNGLQGLHHHRRPPADGRRPRRAHRPDRVRPPPRLPRSAQADQHRCQRTARAARRCSPASPRSATLHAAVVVSVAPQSARVYVRSMGFAQIDWDGSVLGAPALSETRVGAAPKHAEDVVQRGDVIYVVTNGHGHGAAGAAARGAGRAGGAGSQ